MVKPQLLYYNIDPDVVAFSTTRHGGVSQGKYGELNVNRWCGDPAENVGRNTEALARELGILASHIVMPHQNHGLAAVDVDRSLLDRQLYPSDVYDNLMEGVDALYTRTPGICIGVSTADCIPVLLYNKPARLAIAIHAGWRGTAKRVVKHVLTQLLEADPTVVPADFKAVIGPGISLKNFEVGQEVYDDFLQQGFPMELLAKRMGDNGKWYIDLKLCNRMQLEECGVQAENIHDAAICTYDDVDDFFSARRLGRRSGRIFNGIMLLP